MEWLWSPVGTILRKLFERSTVSKNVAMPSDMLEILQLLANKRSRFVFPLVFGKTPVNVFQPRGH